MNIQIQIAYFNMNTKLTKQYIITQLKFSFDFGGKTKKKYIKLIMILLIKTEPHPQSLNSL